MGSHFNTSVIFTRQPYARHDSKIRFRHVRRARVDSEQTKLGHMESQSAMEVV